MWLGLLSLETALACKKNSTKLQLFGRTKFVEFVKIIYSYIQNKGQGKKAFYFWRGAKGDKNIWIVFQLSTASSHGLLDVSLLIFCLFDVVLIVNFTMLTNTCGSVRPKLLTRWLTTANANIDQKTKTANNAWVLRYAFEAFYQILCH